MRRKTRKIVLTARDIELLHFLFKYKLGSVKQINQFCYPTSAERCLRKRLAKLENKQLIERNSFVLDKKAQLIYQITKRGMDKLKEMKGIEVHRNQLKSNSKGHDMFLTYIGETIKQSRTVTLYWTENELQCLKGLNDSDSTMDLVKFHSDGYGLIKRGDLEFNAAIEYEHSQNGEAKYSDLIINYYLCSSTNIVLFFTRHDWIIKFIFNFEEQHYSNAIPKFYIYKMNNELGLIQNLTFQNRKGQTLNL